MATSDHDNDLDEGLDELKRFERGHASFRFGPNGELIYIGTEATAKMRTGETVKTFVARLRDEHGLSGEDTVELLNNGRGEIDTARIIKRAAA